jgi:peptidyl-prolyl cis-trans isomerase A (cyclophilin A)
MRFILLLFTFLSLNYCEDKQKSSQKIEKKKTSKKTKFKIIQENDSVKLKKKSTKLNDKNAMDFFLEYEKKNKENTIIISTDFGDIEILLFEKTKFHRANFIFLTKQKYFNNTQFYRVINNFIIQGGNSDDKETAQKRRDIGRYLLPTDTKRGYTHNRGVLSMPSSDIDNPHKLASPYEFFIVQQQGGAKFLDGDYTIFGKVIKGMNVVDKIAAVATDDGDWPHKNVIIRNVEIVK